MNYPKIRCVAAGVGLTIILMGQSLLVSAETQPRTPSAPNPPAITVPGPKEGNVERRAPVPSERSLDDTTRANAKAVDETTAAPRKPAPPSNVRVSVQKISPNGENLGDPTLTPTGRTRAPLATTLDVPRFTPTLRSATIAARPQVLSDLEAKLSASELALNSLEKSSPEMSTEGRARLRAVADEARESAKNLRQRLREARSADERAWTTVRSQLAEDYAAYAEALTRIDRVAGSPAR